MTKQEALYNYVLRLGDDSLILGQRLAELCGHGPILEEDIALTNISLDLIGQATLFLDYAGALGGEKKSNDDLAFLRLEKEYVNALFRRAIQGLVCRCEIKHRSGHVLQRNRLHFCSAVAACIGHCPCTCDDVVGQAIQWIEGLKTRCTILADFHRASVYFVEHQNNLIGELLSTKY